MSRIGPYLVLIAEAFILTALIVLTRCANYRDVFVGNNIYFIDADCYARMTRVRLCAQHPGTSLRHHSFENFPEGTTPHTTAPLDYAILFVSSLLRPITTRPVDIAGAIISPLLAVASGWFLLWWARIVRLRYRWATLLIFCLSPILVHATALGRPDHHSLILFLIIVAVCVDWSLRLTASSGRSLVSGMAWALAVWVSAYEPLVLLGATVLATCAAIIFTLPNNGRPGRQNLVARLIRFGFDPLRRIRFIAFGVTIGCALLIERRIPTLSVAINDPLFHNWSQTIGELRSIPLLNPIWFRWAGWLILLAPLGVFLGGSSNNGRSLPLTIRILLVLTFFLTVWQSRWAYFFVLFLALTLPSVLQISRWAILTWTAFGLALWPVLQDWDETLWPSDTLAAVQLEQRQQAVELRELAVSLISAERHPFLAPWWLSPAIAYWSGQPGIAGSSHESLPGIEDSARFFLTENPAEAASLLRRRQVSRVIAYDARRVESNSAAVLGRAVPGQCMAEVLDQRSTTAPSFLLLESQNGTGKTFRVANKW